MCGFQAPKSCPSNDWICWAPGRREVPMDEKTKATTFELEDIFFASSLGIYTYRIYI